MRAKNLMEIFLILTFFIQTYLLPVKAWQKGHKNYSRNKIDVFLTFFFSLFLNFSPFSWILDAFLPIIQEKKKKKNTYLTHGPLHNFRWVGQFNLTWEAEQLCIPRVPTQGEGEHRVLCLSCLVTPMSGRCRRNYSPNTLLFFPCNTEGVSRP